MSKLRQLCDSRATADLAECAGRDLLTVRLKDLKLAIVSALRTSALRRSASRSGSSGDNMITNTIDGLRAERLVCCPPSCHGGAHRGHRPSTARQPPSSRSQVPSSYPGRHDHHQAERALSCTSPTATAPRSATPSPSARPARRGAARPMSKASSSAPIGRRRRWSSRDHPELPHFIPGGAPNNPMGERAMTLAARPGGHPRHHASRCASRSALPPPTAASAC